MPFNAVAHLFFQLDKKIEDIVPVAYVYEISAELLRQFRKHVGPKSKDEEMSLSIKLEGSCFLRLS